MAGGKFSGFLNISEEKYEKAFGIVYDLVSGIDVRWLGGR
jgi:hypothetical protein